MYSFFNTKDDTSYGEHVVAIWPQLKVNLDGQLAMIEMYYRNSNYYAPATNFFVRLLQTIAVPKTLNDDRYYENVAEMAMNHSMALGMTSSIYTGRIHSNVLYGKGSQEIVVAVPESFDYYKELLDWRNMRAVTVARHYRSDLLMAPLDGHTLSSESGTAVIFVNIVKLAMQYRAFVMDEYKKATASQQYARATIQHFVYRYVFTNALRSHYDLALFNRLNKRLLGEYGAECSRRLPMGMADYSQRTDYALNRVVTGVIPETKTVREYLTYLPAVSMKNQRDVFMLPDIAPTRHVSWALNYVVEPLIRLYVNAGDGKGARSNGTLISRMTRLRRSLNSDTSYSQVLPASDYAQFKQTLDDFINLKK